MINKKNITKIYYLFLSLHLVLWTTIPFVSNVNLPLDTIEALAWGSNLDWGFSKHPPFSAFAVEIFYFIFGTKGLTIQSLRTQNFYKSKSFWIHTLLDILYLTIPLWVDIFVRYIFYLYKQIQYLMQNKAPRNVYTSL